MPAASGRLALLDSRGPSWTSSPTPWPRPWPKCSPWPAAAMTSRATASTSRPVGPGPHGGQRGLLGGEDELVDLAVARVELAGGEGARAVRAVAVELRAPVDDHERARPGSDVARRRRAAARRARRRRRSAGTTRPAAPSRRIVNSRSSATSRSVRPDEPALEHLGRAPRRPARAAARMRSSSSASLTARSSSISAARAARARRRRRSSSASVPWLLDASGARRRSRAAAGPVGQARRQRPSRSPAISRSQARVDLLGGLRRGSGSR